MAPEGVKRKISAILSADVVGYSKLMEADELLTVQTMESYRKTVSSLILQHNGRVIDSPGDNVLSEFGSVVDAVQCAVEIQHVIKAKNAVLPEARRMEFRIGINLGDVIEEEGRTYGDGINIAARIEKLADSGGICISDSAYQQIETKLALGYEDIGEHSVKNITKPIHVYRIPMESKAVGSAGVKKSGLKRFQWAASALIAAIVISIGSVAVWNHYLKSQPAPEVAKSETATIRAKKAEPSLAEKPSIAVLPFDNMSGDPEQEHFVDGIIEELIAGLSLNSMLSVISRNSTFFYKGKQINIRRISQELGARYIVEGSFRKSGNEIRITAQLIDSSTDRHLWTKTYAREMKNIFSLQGEIAQHIAAALNVESSMAEQARVRRIPTDNLTALGFYWRGLDFFSDFTEEANDRALEYLEKAIELDSQFAEAYVLLGRVRLRYPNAQALRAAIELAQKAIDIDRSLPDAYRLLANTYLHMSKIEEAMIAAEKAVALNPNDADSFFILGRVLADSGKLDEAIKQYDKAIRLNPRYPYYYLEWLYRAYLSAGQYEKAITVAKKALSLNPGWAYANAMMAWGYFNAWMTQQSDDASYPEKALKAFHEARLAPGTHHNWMTTAYLLLKQHDKAIIELEKALNADGYRGHVAISLSWLGRHEEAIRLIEENNLTSLGQPALTLGGAYRITGQYEKSLSALMHATGQNLDHAMLFWNHIELAILYSELGREEDAKAEAEEILTLIPNFSVDVWGERHPRKDRSQVERDMAALRKAGLK